MPPPILSIASVQIEHLRGFRHARLDLTGPLLLVGPNNSGKSSLFVLLDAIFKWDIGVLRGDRDLLPEEESALLPSRDSRGRARRLHLRVAFTDTRLRNRYAGKDGFADLKLTITGRRCCLTLSPPTRVRQQTEPRAIALLQAAPRLVGVRLGSGRFGGFGQHLRSTSRRSYGPVGTARRHGWTRWNYQRVPSPEEHSRADGARYPAVGE